MMHHMHKHNKTNKIEICTVAISKTRQLIWINASCVQPIYSLISWRSIKIFSQEAKGVIWKGCNFYPLLSEVSQKFMEKDASEDVITHHVINWCPTPRLTKSQQLKCILRNHLALLRTTKYEIHLHRAIIPLVNPDIVGLTLLQLAAACSYRSLALMANATFRAATYVPPPAVSSRPSSWLQSTLVRHSAGFTVSWSPLEAVLCQQFT